MLTLVSNSITARIIVATALCLFLILALLATISYSRERSAILEARFDRLHAIAHSLSVSVDGDLHQQLTEALPTKDAITLNDQHSLYQSLRQPLAQTAKSLQLHTPIYTLLIDERKRAAIEQQRDKKHSDGLQFALTSAGEPYFRHSYEYIPQLGTVFFDKETVQIEPYRSSNGTWISVITPVINSNGMVVAALEVDEKLDDILAAFNAAFARTVLIIVSLMIISLILMGWVGKRISAPVIALNEAAKRFGDGDFAASIPAQGSDEIGQLAAVLEHARGDIHSFITRILGAFPGILVSFDHNGIVQRHLSQSTIDLFGDITGESIHQALFANDSALKDMAAIAFDASTDISFTDLLGLAPQELTHNNKHFSLSYVAINDPDSGDLVGILLLGTDVTAQRALQAEASAEAKHSRMLLTLLGNQGLFANFSEECKTGFQRAHELLQQTVIAEADIHELFRIVHTIKGSAASLAIWQLAETAHGFEEELDHARESGTLENSTDTRTKMTELETILEAVKDEYSQLTGGQQSSLSIEEAELDGLIQQCDANSSLQQQLQALKNPQLNAYVASKGRMIVDQTVAATGKNVELSVSVPSLRTDTSVIQVLEGCLPHLLRNAIDHGIEDGDTRVEFQKPEQGQIHISAAIEHNTVTLDISDDGQGIDADMIRVKAVEKGLLDEDTAMDMSDDDARMMIFAAGFSTAEQVSSVSGRGVGMDAVKRRVEDFGGQLSLHSTSGKGSTITIALPLP